MTTVASWAQGTADATPVDDASAPALEQMPRMLRRHAARLGRMSCDVAYRALDGALNVPIVFVSRYGEVDRSVELLTALAEGRPVSPTAFSLSVHNAVAGLFSMARADTSNSIALAAGPDSAEYAMFEACGLLDDGEASVLVVSADCPLPGVFREFGEASDQAYAWACLIAPAGPRSFTLARRRSSADQARNAPSPSSPAMDAFRFLVGVAPHYTRVARESVWEWSRHA